MLYATNVIEAHDIGAVAEAYDPAELIAQADAHDLYTITRIVTFDDPIRSEARRESKLAGTWMDPADPANWEYPLELAVEACGLGFDEVQFDYVRYPAGRTARAASARTPATPDERVAVIEAFLAEARARLHPLGCALSADVFAIVLSAENDQGIGQRPEGPVRSDRCDQPDDLSQPLLGRVAGASRSKRPPRDGCRRGSRRRQ